MTPPKRSSRKKLPLRPSPAENGVVRLKVWLGGISLTVWRRLLVPSTRPLRELHGIIQVAMDWEGIHLYQFCLRAARYGSWELSASSPEVIRRRGPWRSSAAVEFATLEWVDWFHHRRLLEPIGNIPPAETEARSYAQIAGQAMAA